MSYLHFEGTVTTLSNLASAPPTNKRQSAKEPARLPRMPIYTGEKTGETVFFPANGFRCGGLRRASRLVFFHAYGQEWNVDTLRLMTIGGAKGTAGEGVINLDQIAHIRKNCIHLSLFGCTTDDRLDAPWMAGKFGVGPLVPVTPIPIPQMTKVRKDPATAADAFDFLSAEAAHELNTVLLPKEREVTRARARIKVLETAIEKDQTEDGKELMPKDKKAYKDEIKELDSKVKAIQAEIGNRVSIQMPLAGYEYIPAGWPLKSTMSLRNGTDAEIGLVFKTLEMFAQWPQLGAHAAEDCGKITAEWQVLKKDSLRTPGKIIGTVKLVPYVGIEFEDSGGLQELIEVGYKAWDTYVESIQGKTIRELLVP